MNLDVVMNFAGLALEIGFPLMLSALFADSQQRGFDF